MLKRKKQEGVTSFAATEAVRVGLRRVHDSGWQRTAYVNRAIEEHLFLGGFLMEEEISERWRKQILKGEDHIHPSPLINQE